MSRLLPVFAGMVALVGYALAEGYWTNRWTASAALAEATERLRQVPIRVEDWVGEEQELDPREARQGEIHAALLRNYKNRVTGDVVRVVLVCGRPGPIAVHTPEVCLGGGGFSLVKSAVRHQAQTQGKDVFWVGRFHKAGQAVPENVEVYWSWNARGSWEAVDGARLAFARERVLYKLYLLRPIPVAEELAGNTDRSAEEQASPAASFLNAFLPEVNRCLFPEDPA